MTTHQNHQEIVGKTIVSAEVRTGASGEAEFHVVLSDGSVMMTGLTEVHARQLRIGQAIERASAEMPDGYFVDIFLERGYVGVNLNDPEGELTEVEGSDDDVSKRIHSAIDLALRESDPQEGRTA